MNKIKIVVLLCCMFVYACNDDDDTGARALSIQDIGYANLTYDGVTLYFSLSGNIQHVTKKGFCYSTEPEVDIYDQTVEVKLQGDVLKVELTGLLPKTTYFVKAFALPYNEGPVYSAEISFTTPSQTEEDKLANYVAPEYNDNYTSIAGWSDRNQWNLANVHDPTVMKADDGYYYMYQTDASYGNAHNGHGHFHARRSEDLVNWEYLGATMSVAPDWVKTKLNEYRSIQGLPHIDSPSYGFWAPVVRNLGNGKYRMYYSIIIDNYIKTGAINSVANFDNSWTERAFIGMAETSDPSSNIWEDKGFVICSSSDKGMNEWERSSLSNWNSYFKYNAIDPSYTITKEGEHWLTYGSWHSGIVTLQVDAITGKPLSLSDTPWSITDQSGYGTLIQKRGNSRWQGSEAPEVIYNPATGFYYLFVAYDELSIAYNTRVARSTNINGPYIGIDGKNVTEGSTIMPIITHPYRFANSYGWVGISHCSVFDDGAGNWFYASQARFPSDVPNINAPNAIMMGHIRSIQWTEDGWPVVMPERYGAVPQADINEEDLIGTWENIFLKYQYQVQQTSTSLVLSADKKASGAIVGNWSYDASKRILTIGSYKVILQREVDWESNPRVHTIVYAGLTSTGVSIWGKKVN